MDLTGMTWHSHLLLSFASVGLAMVMVGNAVPKNASPPSTPSENLVNCSRTRNSAEALKLLDKDKSENDVLTDEKASNCSDMDVIIQRIPPDLDNWKNHVIIGCTFTVAVEILIVVLMVMYWQQIRWTLRKLSCPCDQRRNRHTQMQRQEPADVVFDSDSEGDVPPPDEIQIFTSPPIENTDVDGQSADDRPTSIDDGGSGFFPEFRRTSVGASPEAWNIFASSSSDDELESADVSGRRYVGVDDRFVSWQ